MPPGTFIPVLVYPNMAEAVRWLCATFGFTERLRIGTHRIQLCVGDQAAIVVVQATGDAALVRIRPEPSPLPDEPPYTIRLRVPDVDRHYAQARQCGAHIIQPPTDFPYGEHQYTVLDVAGYQWTFTQSIADIDPRDWGRGLT